MVFVMDLLMVLISTITKSYWQIYIVFITGIIWDTSQSEKNGQWIPLKNHIRLGHSIQVHDYQRQTKARSIDTPLYSSLHIALSYDSHSQHSNPFSLPHPLCPSLHLALSYVSHSQYSNPSSFRHPMCHPLIHFSFSTLV